MSDNNAFSFYNVIEFFNYAESIKERWVVENWLPKGCLLCFIGEQKKGKSTINFSLIPALASGGKWLDEINAVQCPIIYLDYENPAPYIRDNLLQYLPKEQYETIKNNIFIPAELPKPLTLTWLQGFIQYAGLKDKSGVIFIDSATPAFNAMFPTTPNWSNQETEVSKALSTFRDFAHKSGWSVVITRHENKTGGTLGSVAWEYAPDFFWRYKTLGTGRELSITGRLLNTPSPLIIKKVDNRIYLEGTKKEVKQEEWERKMLLEKEQVLNTIPYATETEVKNGASGMTIADLITLFDGKIGQKRVRNYVTKLKEENQVATGHLGKGKEYRVVYYRPGDIVFCSVV